MVREDLGRDPSWAQMLMKVARDPIISNRAHVHALPPSWGTLYELTKVEPKLLKAAIKDHRVNPKMERKQVAALLPAQTVNSPDDHLAAASEIAPQVEVASCQQTRAKSYYPRNAFANQNPRLAIYREQTITH